MLFTSYTAQKDAEKAVYEDITTNTSALQSHITRQLHATDSEEGYQPAAPAVQLQEAQGLET